MKGGLEDGSFYKRVTSTYEELFNSPERSDPDVIFVRMTWSDYVRVLWCWLRYRHRPVPPAFLFGSGMYYSFCWCNRKLHKDLLKL